MAMRPAETYILYATYSREKTGNIITFAQFEEGGLFSETCDDTECGHESDDDSTLPPLISEEKIDVMSLGYESDAEPMSTEMSEDIHGGSQSYPIINRREVRYNIRDCNKKG